MPVSHVADTGSVSFPTLNAAGTGPRSITGGRPDKKKRACRPPAGPWRSSSRWPSKFDAGPYKQRNTFDKGRPDCSTGPVKRTVPGYETMRRRRDRIVWPGQG